jgi:uncharacterized repeat protein (TIGR04076 family)
MGNVYRIIAKVEELRNASGKGPCSLYQLGQEFDLSKLEEKEKICEWAYHSLFPFYSMLKYDGTIPWEPDPNKALVSCPDPHNVVVFELRREGALEENE